MVIFIPNIGNNLAAFPQLVVAPVANVPLEGIDFLLDTVGFQNLAEHMHIIETGLTDYEDFRYLIDKDIQDMLEEFSKWMVAQGRITFGIGCIKRLTGLMHWIQDCFHANDDPDSVTFDEAALAEGQSRALIRKSDIDLVDMNTKVANPSKFKDEHKWPEWSKAFINYLSVMPGVNGVPLVYVVCKKRDLKTELNTLPSLSG